VVKVKLSGLKITKGRGKYYVYRRDSGVAIVRAFEGSKAELLKRLAMPDAIGAYNTGRKRTKAAAYPEHSLGWLVAWFTDPAQNADFAKLAPVTRAAYKDRLNFLEPEFDAPLDTITQPALYEVRDRCMVEKWPAFADKMMTAASSMFKKAMQRGWMVSNPAQGIERAGKPNKNANREWRPEEWLTVMKRAPPHLQTAYMIARYLGYRSQSIVAVKWTNYKPDERFGACFRMNHRKNNEDNHWLPAAPILQAYLDGLDRTSDVIATRYNGKPWESPEQLQKQSSNFLAKLEKEGVVAEGLTLHGLRVTFAADIKRVTGANDDQVAAALGDRDRRMGSHYTRHVEQENRLMLVFFAKARTEQDLENAKDNVFQKAQQRAKNKPKKK
jgi:integrase